VFVNNVLPIAATANLEPIKSDWDRLVEPEKTP
jgi:hypothetical protein